MQNSFVILDFGSQVSKLIARRLREEGYYSELVPFNTDLQKIRERAPVGIILSGGPSSVHDNGAPRADVKALLEIAPLLGICYGMQLLSHELGGLVETSSRREYGANVITWSTPLVAGLRTKQKTWMSHGDVVRVPPPGFEILAISESGHPAAIAGARCLGLQFHPEVAHTEQGLLLLRHFAETMCRAPKNWNTGDILERIRAFVRSEVPSTERVLCALSGGVDSTVVAKLLTDSLGAERVHCVFVDTGLLRHNEFSEVLNIYQKLGLSVKGVDASQVFLKRLANVSDPEEKRKIIGHTFIEVFEREVKKATDLQWLAQGTLYPDVIESVSLTGASVTIKSHHNVGGLPKNLGLKLIEPLRDLFKDEVREIGKTLKIPSDILGRHPFPGPGLAIRVLGAIDEESLRIARRCDAVFIDELRSAGLYEKVWQAAAVLLPIRTVGVQGDGRSYDKVVALRVVTSSDGMTADWYPFPNDFLARVSNRLTNEVRGVNRVVYDITSKPPGTIEWE
jgi:GMP synthase (glutamine-hydrolysing)